MRNEYSKPLYELYKKARDFRNDFRKVVEFLMEDESGLAPIKRTYIMGNDITPDYQMMFRKNIRTFADSQLNAAFSKLRDFRNEWRRDVGDIIDKLPQISFRMRFDEPDDKNTVGIRMGEIGREYSRDMDTFIDLYDQFDSEVEELFKIIGDYEKSIYQPSDFIPDQVVKLKRKNVVYRLNFDEIRGKLFLNGIEIYKCNLNSKLDKALSLAFKTPEVPVKTNGSVASALKPIRVPEGLKKLMFRASKSSFVVKLEITADDLKEAGLDKQTLDAEFQNLSK